MDSPGAGLNSGPIDFGSSSTRIFHQAFINTDGVHWVVALDVIDAAKVQYPLTYSLFEEGKCNGDMAALKLTDGPERRLTITPSPVGSPRRLSPVASQGQDPAGNVWSNVAGVSDADDKFQVNLDVSNFNTTDLSVKSVGKRLIIEGKQIEREPRAGTYVAREFNLNYVLPQDVHVDEMTSSFSERGLLTIEAPKMPSPKPSPMNKRKN